DIPPPYPGPYGVPTVVTGMPGADPTAPPPTRVAPGAYGPAADEERSRRSGAGVLLVAGVLVLLLALGALVWALVHSGGDSGAGKNTAATSAPGPASHSAPRSGAATTSHGATTGAPSSTSPSPGPSGSATPAQSVKVSLRSLRGSYRGTCPPPDDAAPAVVATFTVSRTPVDVQYRWVTADGESSDRGWKTLEFGSGAARSREVRHVESGYGAAGTTRNAVRLEVRSPVAVTSGSVAYAITCEEGTPTSGAPSSTASSASASSPSASSSASAEVTTGGDQAALAKVGR
ncbi:hypothetical protein ACJA3G_33910, partial [Streptomyces sp. YS-3]